MRSARFAALAVGGVSVVWAAWLLAFGGFDVRLLGLRIRSNNAERVILLAVVAHAVFLVTGGRIPIVRALSALRRGAAAAARHPGWLAGLLAIVSVLIAYAGSTRIAGGSDAYGYASQADLWLRGNLKIPQPWVEQVPWPDAMWTFTPLGYRPAPSTGDWSIVPTYSPGLPLLLAAAKLFGGQCAMFAVVPLCIGLAVLATYGLGARLNAKAVGLFAAWLVATSPVVLGSLEPLTDVPVMAAWTIAMYFLLGSSSSSAAAAGLFAALAILIRPNLFPLAAAMLAWFFIRRGVNHDRLRDRLLPAALFGFGILAGMGAVALINQHLYGSAATSGYGRLQDQFAWPRILPNLRRYLSWLIETQTPVAVLGFVPLLIPMKRFWPGVRDRRVFAIFASFVIILWGIYAAYLEFDSWGYLRFLLPSWPPMMLGVASVLASKRVRPSNPPPTRSGFGEVSPEPGETMKRAKADWAKPAGQDTIPVGAAAALIAVGLWTVNIALDLDLYDQRQAARHEAPIGRLVRAHTPENSIVLAFERSGSMRYYTGRTTMRYDVLDGEWLDRAIEWLRARGIRLYAVLDERQAAEAKHRFATQRAAERFDHPFLTYEPAGTSLFDLSEPPDPGKQPTIITEPFEDVPGCDPPVPPTPLVLK